MWNDDQEWEAGWWGDCTNTYAEETKQLTYAHRMGLTLTDFGDGRWPVMDLQGRSVLDIGGGPVSMLLKTRNGGARVIADPCQYPEWIAARYDIAGIEYHIIEGESLLDIVSDLPTFDEVWIYNVLQHTHDPALIVANARALAPVVRMFEWVDLPPHPGHPQMLKAKVLDGWLSGRGTVEQMNENGCHGRAYYGVFESSSS